jgi:PAS domain S-box-containing protein
MLEDNPDDAEMIKRELTKTGLKFTSKRVETREEFTRELEENPPDVLLVDYSLPAFDGVFALAIAKEKAPKVPFIFVSGEMSEELAIETLKMGAADWVSKGQLSRLGPVVCRVLDEVKGRARYEQLEKSSDGKTEFAELSKLIPETVFEMDLAGKLSLMNQVGLNSIGYSQEDIDRGLNGIQLLVPEDREGAKEQMKKAMDEKGEGVFEGTVLRKDGKKVPVVIHFAPLVRAGEIAGFRGVIIRTDSKPAGGVKRWLRGGPRKKPRGIVDIYADILKAAGKGVSKSRLVAKANLNFPRFERYLTIMVEEGLLKIRPGPAFPSHEYARP